MDHHLPAPPSWPELLAVRPRPAIPLPTRSVFLWGDVRVPGVALRTAALAVAKGLQVAILDAGTAFQLTPLVAAARTRRVRPEVFLRQIHLARAFTCWQFTTLLGERLAPLLAAHPIGVVMLLNPLTHFLEEEVTDREATILLRRALNALAGLSSDGPRMLVAQTIPAYPTARRIFARDLLRVVDVGLRLQPRDGRWSVDVVKPRPSAPDVHAPPG